MVINENEQKIEKPIFKTHRYFCSKLESYMEHCRENKRLPNVAGFCCYARIKREDFHRLREFYPLQYDICESAFIDEALNTKVMNSGATMSYLRSLNVMPENGDENGYTVICEHDAQGDGE